MGCFNQFLLLLSPLITAIGIPSSSHHQTFDTFPGAFLNQAKIAFNGKYLAEVLGVLSEEQVALEITTPSSPGVIRPVGVDNYVHVVMPMFVQW